MIEVTLYTAPWCEPCKSFKPYYKELAIDYPDITFDVIDVSEHPKLANAMKVRSVPTVLITEDGDILDRFVNPTTADQMRPLIDNNHFIG